MVTVMEDLLFKICLRLKNGKIKIAENFSKKINNVKLKVERNKTLIQLILILRNVAWIAI